MDRGTERGTGASDRPTGQGTAHPRRGSARHAGRSGAAGAALLLLFALAAVATPQLAGTAGAQEDTVLAGSGIRYPGGFDPNTVGEVRGKATGLSRPEHGPVRFLLRSDRDTYTVLAAPTWFWNDLKIELPDGTPVRVRGSKSVGKDGRLYIIAQEVILSAKGRSLSFRDDAGSPLWRGAGAGRAGRGMGTGSPMGGPGGMRGGMGGRMPGRR